MNTRRINPWKWQDNFGFVQGIESSAIQRILVCSGQTSVNREGFPVNQGDMAAQIDKCFDNIEVILHQSGFQFSDIIHLKYYTTDIGAFSAAGKELIERLSKEGCAPTSTLLGVTSLFHPDIMVEIEAIAAQ